MRLVQLSSLVLRVLLLVLAACSLTSRPAEDDRIAELEDRIDATQTQLDEAAAKVEELEQKMNVRPHEEQLRERSQQRAEVLEVLPRGTPPPGSAGGNRVDPKRVATGISCESKCLHVRALLD